MPLGQIRSFLGRADEFKWEVSSVFGCFHVTASDGITGLSGSGFAENELTARKIALSEVNERYMMSQLADNQDLRAQWGLDVDESCSGFAVGYSKSKTILRAVCEATERWALAKWIDDGHALSTLANPTPTALRTGITNYFQSTSLLHIDIPILLEASLVSIKVVVALGWTPRGVFAGYGARLKLEEAVDHAWIEAMRNYLIYKNQSRRHYFPYDRIGYFAENRRAAEAAVAKADPNLHWTSPRLELLKFERVDDLWISRAMMSQWTPWQEGTTCRFLY